MRWSCAAARPTTPTAAPVDTAEVKASLRQSISFIIRTKALPAGPMSRDPTYGMYNTRRPRSRDSLWGVSKVTQRESASDPMMRAHFTSCAKWPPVVATSRCRPAIGSFNKSATSPINRNRRPGLLAMLGCRARFSKSQSGSIASLRRNLAAYRQVRHRVFPYRWHLCPYASIWRHFAHVSTTPLRQRV